MAAKLTDLFRRFRREARPPGWAKPSLIIVGLGNPGPKYRNTRHNVGFWCIDELTRRAGAKLARRDRRAEIAETFIEGEPVVLARSRTFVNESGIAVRYLVRRYSADHGQLVVILDDMDLSPGVLRVRKSGSAGGHNGLRSIVSETGTQEFVRIRIGIGRPMEQGDEVDHVLGTFPPEQRDRVDQAVLRAADAVEHILSDGIDRAMNEFN